MEWCGPTAWQSSPVAALSRTCIPLGDRKVQRSHSWHRGPSFEPHNCLSKYYNVPISLLSKPRARLCPVPSPGTQKGRLNFHQGLGQRLPTEKQRMFPGAEPQGSPCPGPVWHRLGTRECYRSSASAWSGFGFTQTLFTSQIQPVLSV